MASIKSNIGLVLDEVNLLGALLDALETLSVFDAYLDVRLDKQDGAPFLIVAGREHFKGECQITPSKFDDDTRGFNLECGEEQKKGAGLKTMAVFVSEHVLLNELVGLSRMGPSSDGKSFEVELTLRLSPEDNGALTKQIAERCIEIVEQKMPGVACKYYPSIINSEMYGDI